MKYVVGLALMFIFAIVSAISPAGVVSVRLAEKMPVLLAVLLAAVFVRLARGLPTIPYDKVPVSRVLLVTKAFRSLVRSYVQTFVIFMSAITINLVCTSLDISQVERLPLFFLPALLGFTNALVVFSLFLLVRSDVTLASLQADLADEVALKLSSDVADKSAAVVRDAFKSTSRESPKISLP